MQSRLLDPELLDAPFHDERALDESLVLVAQVNRWLGGVAPVRRHLEVLAQDGWRILEPGVGSVACGDEGQGRMMEPAEIMAILQEQLG